VPTFAAIDIGSNSCRLAIASVQNHSLRTLHEDREVVRLGESVFEMGMISPDAMANTIRALKRFQKAVQMHVVDKVRVVATSAMRDAGNAAAFIAWVKSSTGWDVDVISGLEEGRLIHLGVVTQEPGARGRCVLIDLGGGSCEVTLSEAGKIREIVSMPLGAVRLQQEFLHSDPPTREDLHRLQSFIDRELTRAYRRIGEPRVPLVIATSGTAAALTEAASATTVVVPGKGATKRPALKKSVAKKKVGVEKIQPLSVTMEQVKLTATRLAKMTNAQRQAVPGIGPKRSDIIVGGAMVYSSMMQRLGLGAIRYSPLSLRDGILAQMLADTDIRASVHRAVEEERWSGVLRVARRYGVDMKQAEPVRAHAVKLFDLLARVHQLPEEYRFWLASAAVMNDVGKFMNHQGHHRHTQYIIANSEIFGFSPVQRAIVSAIARYLGKSRPDAEDRPMRFVPPDEHFSIRRAIVLLRLAVALNQDKASDTLRVAVKIYPKSVVLQLHASRGNAELESWSARKEAAYFREIFRRELLVEVA